MGACNETCRRPDGRDLRPFERLCRHCGTEHSTRQTCEQAWAERERKRAIAWTFADRQAPCAHGTEGAALDRGLCSACVAREAT